MAYFLAPFEETHVTVISVSTAYLLLDVNPAAYKAFCNFSSATKFKSFSTYYQFKTFHSNYKLQTILFLCMIYI